MWKVQENHISQAARRGKMSAGMLRTGWALAGAMVLATAAGVYAQQGAAPGGTLTAMNATTQPASAPATVTLPGWVTTSTTQPARVTRPRSLQVILPGGQNPTAVANPNSAWLGVVLGEVPEALRQHLKLSKDQGIMVRNIVQGGPADKVLQRYDIILAADVDPTGSEVSKFVEQVGQKKPGDEFKLIVLQAGVQKELRVKLAPRPANPAALPLVYEEEQAALPGPGALRGRWLHRDPQGNVIITDELPADLPQDIARTLQELLRQQMGGPGGAAVPGRPGAPGGLLPHAGAMQYQISGPKSQIQVSVMRDGKMYSFKQDGDPIEVMISGPQGVQKKAYATAEEMKQADPETYQVYDEFVGKLKVQMIGPNLNLRMDAENEAQDQPGAPGGVIIKARPMTTQPNGDGGSAGTGAAPAAGPARKTLAVTPLSAASTVFTVGAHGEITVEMNTAGTMLKKTYATEADLARQDPGVYEKYRKMMNKLEQE